MTSQPARLLALFAATIALSSLSSVACTTPNASHCGNRDGDDTCLTADPDRPYCSVCVAENDGCVDAPVSETCRPNVGGETLAEGSGTDATMTGTTVSSTTLSSTGDPSTTGQTSTTASTTSPTSTTASSTTADESETAAPGDTTAGESSGSPTTGVTDSPTTEGSSGEEASETSTSATSSDPTTEGSGASEESTTEPDDCGNGALDPGEQCDGNQLNGTTCAGLQAFMSGTLACDDACNFDTSACTACLPGLGICSAHDDCCSQNCTGLIVTGVCAG